MKRGNGRHKGKKRLARVKAALMSRKSAREGGSWARRQAAKKKNRRSRQGSVMGSQYYR